MAYLVNKVELGDDHNSHGTICRQVFFSLQALTSILFGSGVVLDKNFAEIKKTAKTFSRKNYDYLLFIIIIQGEAGSKTNR